MVYVCSSVACLFRVFCVWSFYLHFTSKLLPEGSSWRFTAEGGQDERHMCHFLCTFDVVPACLQQSLHALLCGIRMSGGHFACSFASACLGHFVFIFTWCPHVWGALCKHSYMVSACLGDTFYYFYMLSACLGETLYPFLQGICMSADALCMHF